MRKTVPAEMADLLLVNQTARMAPLNVRRDRYRGRLSAAAEELLVGALAPEAVEFARATTIQTAHRLGAPAPSADEELEVARAVVDLLTSAVQGILFKPSGPVEARETLISAAFQNLDLLYGSDYPYADAVSALIMHLAWPPNLH
jgi:hypothetical protein